MKNIKNYNLPELKEEFVSIGEKPFRAEQVFKWIYEQNATSFDEMTNLSLELREKLKENYTLNTFKILKKQKSAYVFRHKLVAKWVVNFVLQQEFHL